MHRAAIYEIHIRGQLDADWSDWFDGMTLSYAPEATETILSGTVRDQAQLYGLLEKLRNLNLTLLTVECREQP